MSSSSPCLPRHYMLHPPQLPSTRKAMTELSNQLADHIMHYTPIQTISSDGLQQDPFKASAPDRIETNPYHFGDKTYEAFKECDDYLNNTQPQTFEDHFTRIQCVHTAITLYQFHVIQLLCRKSSVFGNLISKALSEEAHLEQHLNLPPGSCATAHSGTSASLDFAVLVNRGQIQARARAPTINNPSGSSGSAINGTGGRITQHDAKAQALVLLQIQNHESLMNHTFQTSSEHDTLISRKGTTTTWKVHRINLCSNAPTRYMICFDDELDNSDGILSEKEELVSLMVGSYIRLEDGR
ncbi:hypothetical protein BDN72DRAFT_849289 [Pluteus cervinus]|uniref:Uncharacterized protein n=1 Tax=Pluteus cervinus TaxID=181527 RepID=A0ACD3A8X4_9AGAR|nr:hypothetical protein BDN72DRAFT_849289 [Pluteus cervinus]